jgi:hypothetical protein
MDLHLRAAAVVAVVIVTTIPQYKILMTIITFITITIAQREDVSEQSRPTLIKKGTWN